MLSVLSPRGLQAIRPGEDLTLKFILHGINIIGQDDFEVAVCPAVLKTFRARGDIFSLAIWCSGQGFLPPAPPGAREPEHAEYFKISVDSGPLGGDAGWLTYQQESPP